MRAPAFWERPSPSPLAHLLRPLGSLYGAIAARRMRFSGEQADLPVVCIGNFTAGGAGKTPTALAVARLLQEAGEKPVFLSRGYGGRLSGPVRVEPHHTAGDVGDEPLLLARAAVAVVSRDRPAGARLAHEIGATVIIMDDGLQNPSLAKDCVLAVLDGATGIGNGLPLPAGPLRAPLAAQWPAVDALVVIGHGAAGDRMAREAEGLGKRVFQASLVPDTSMAARLRGRRILAFAGIGRPEKFFETLRACGAIVEDTRAFPDHHAYSDDDIAALREKAKRQGLTPVTTEKDFARIVSLKGPKSWPDLAALPVALRFSEEEALCDLLLHQIAERRSRGG